MSSSSLNILALKTDFYYLEVTVWYSILVTSENVKIMLWHFRCMCFFKYTIYTHGLWHCPLVHRVTVRCSLPNVKLGWVRFAVAQPNVTSIGEEKRTNGSVDKRTVSLTVEEYLTGHVRKILVVLFKLRHTINLCRSIISNVYQG